MDLLKPLNKRNYQFPHRSYRTVSTKVTNSSTSQPTLRYTGKGLRNSQSFTTARYFSSRVHTPSPLKTLLNPNSSMRVKPKSTVISTGSYTRKFKRKKNLSDLLTLRKSTNVTLCYDQDASQMGIYICRFNRQVYLHTSELSEKELDEKSKTILQYYNIYSVCYNKKRSFEAIDVEIAKFFTIAVDEYYREKFTTAGVIVELSKNQRSFYILGKPGTPASVMMQAKTTLKNLIEGLTVVVFKNTVL
jgi:hypothetical protein